MARRPGAGGNRVLQGFGDSCKCVTGPHVVFESIFASLQPTTAKRQERSSLILACIRIRRPSAVVLGFFFLSSPRRGGSRVETRSEILSPRNFRSPARERRVGLPSPTLLLLYFRMRFAFQWNKRRICCCSRYIRITLASSGLLISVLLVGLYYLGAGLLYRRA